MLDTSDEPGPPDVRLTLPAVRDSVLLARHVLAGLIAAQPLSPRRQEQALRALGEAATDAVLHASGDEEDSSRLVVEGHARSDRLVLVVIGPDRGTEVRMAFPLRRAQARPVASRT